MKESIMFKMLGGGVIVGITYLFGGLDQVLQILLVMIVIDYITGWIGSAINGKLSSKVGFKGIFKKVCILIMIVIAVQLDKMMGQVNVIRYIVCFFYISNEAISILENISKAGVPLPKFLLDLLHTMNDQANEGNLITRKDES